MQSHQTMIRIWLVFSNYSSPLVRTGWRLPSSNVFEQRASKQALMGFSMEVVVRDVVFYQVVWMMRTFNNPSGSYKHSPEATNSILWTSSCK